MILERHYDDEALLAIMSCGKEAVARDAHLSGCVICMDNLESYQTMAEVLGEKSVWDFSEDYEEGAAKGAAAIRTFVEKMDNEDATAERLVEELLESPRQWWLTTIEADERYRRVSIARRLIEISEEKIGTMPPDAVELAQLAIRVAEIFQQRPEVLQVLGAAYRQHGYALFIVGEYDKALESVESGHTVLQRHPSAAYDLARLDIVRSLVYSEQKRFDEALAIARRAAGVFHEFGDDTRFIAARSSEAYMLNEAHNFRAALDIHLELKNRYSDHMDLAGVAALYSNIGMGQWRTGSVVEAVDSLQIAAQLYGEINNKSALARVIHNLGLLLLGQGRRAEAKTRLQQAHDEFARLGMVHPAVVASLDLAEIALLEGNFEDVEELCSAAIRKFEAAGVAYSREALTALTFLREAAEQRRATQATIWHVKTYIRRLPEQPALLFAPAPLPPA